MTGSTNTRGRSSATASPGDFFAAWKIGFISRPEW